MFARMDDNNRNIGQGGADQGQGAGARQARRMHTVRPEHVQTIQAMFPDIPEAAIRADLARTGSPAVTSDNILRNGGTLPLPPATRAEQSAGAAAAASGHAHIGATNSGGQNAGTIGSATASGIALNTSHSPLVNRLRISKDADAGELPLAPPKIWETDPNRRADVLRKRKEFMLMEARKKYLERQKTPPKPDETGSSVSTKIPTETEPKAKGSESSSPPSAEGAIPSTSNAS
ncbi:hypothetical protein IW140_000997 [Coemansia sp. RSA 1813]|nr:hypothetical protein LPJ74_000587 [Coemansia sp. RSA 1843]KAJ2091552.1 hypothetical protein IW138_001780 [Coemansia sp. RSA 986]KAJ2572248.1 hypothetical protein IW140_000997 [Coemansia sp. RSA 1813]